MKPAKQASFSCRNAIFMEFMCDIYQIWTICKSTALLFDGKLRKKFPSQKCMSILAYTIITSGFPLQLFSVVKRVPLISKWLKIFLYMRSCRCNFQRNLWIPSVLADRADVDLGIQITFIISYVGNENIFTSFFWNPECAFLCSVWT